MSVHWALTRSDEVEEQDDLEEKLFDENNYSNSRDSRPSKDFIDKMGYITFGASVVLGTGVIGYGLYKLGEYLF